MVTDSRKFAGTILVVEDFQEIRALMCRQIEGLGYFPVDYPDGDALIQGLREDGELRFGMAFVDLSLPGRRNGEEVIMELNRLYPERPLVVVSGRAVGDDRNGGYWTNPKMVAASSGTLSKPYKLEDLRRAIETNLKHN